MARKDPDPQCHRPDSEPQRWAEVYRLAINPGVSASLADGTALVSVLAGGTALVSVFGRRHRAGVSVWAAVKPWRGA